MNDGADSDMPFRQGDMSEISQTAAKMNGILDSMRENDVFKLYEKLAIETRKRLS